MNNVPAPLSAVDVSWNRFQEQALLLNASVGSARITLGPNFPVDGDTKTGLANLATTYTATVRIDGVDELVSVVGSAAQTITTLLAELNADLSATVTLDGNDIVITSTTSGPASSVFVSDTLAGTATVGLFAGLRGAQNTVTIGPETFVVGPSHFGVTNYDSTRGWFGIAASTNRVGSSVRGNSKYLRWDKMGGGMQEDVADAIDAFLAAGVANTNQPWINAAAGIAITDPGTVPATLQTASVLSRATVYQLQVNVNGAGNVTVFVDLNIPQTFGAPFDQVLAAVNAGLAAAVQSDGSPLPVVAEWQQGYNNTTQPSMLVLRVLPSNTLYSVASAGLVLQGASTSLVLTDGLANGLVAAITAVVVPDFTAAIDTAQAGFGIVNFNRVNAAAVTPATVPAVPAGNYDFTVNVEDAGVRASYNVTVAVLPAESMTVIAANMQIALRVATGELEEVTAEGNKFLIANEAAGTGFNSYVTVTVPTAGANPDLFNAIAAALDVVDRRGNTGVQTWSVDGFATPGVNGATDLAFPKTVDTIVYDNWLEVLDSMQIGGRLSGQFVHGPTGYGPLFTSDAGASFEKENRPQALGQCVNRTLYWDGAAWRYFVTNDASRANTDDASAGTNNPPQTLDSGI